MILLCIFFQLFTRFELFHFFVGEATKTPDIPAELLVTELGNLEAGFGLDERFATAKGEAGLAFEAPQAIFYFFDVDEDAASEVPGLGVLTAWAVIGATLGPEHGPEAVPVYDVVMLDRAG